MIWMKMRKTSHKPWQQKKYERPYSAQNQSLQICYINESCSSDESDGGKKSSDKANHNNPQEKSPVSPAFSPTNSPGFMSPKGYGKRYLRQNRLSNASSHSSSSSSLSFQNNTSENTIIHNHHSDLRSGRSKQEELEIEARFQLAEAQQKAKLEAEEFKKLPKTRDLSLRSTLSEELQRKISCYGLTGKDCQRMKLKQLQVILKDLQIKQQVLSGSLVQLLLERDGLQTEQDSKLLDIEDIKTMMSSLGPETTV
uniref:Schwannomin interacting protein 1 C-terminal domain-containing protein n=1 Tax=Ciona savignyi TaxID=51511 RepID=H2Z611_CIOSA